jgi:hypothetical protein
MPTVDEIIKEGQDKLNQAGVESNKFVQKEGPVVVEYIKKYWWVGVGLLVLLVVGHFIF